jgi:hypothetical protein
MVATSAQIRAAAAARLDFSELATTALLVQEAGPAPAVLEMPVAVELVAS